MSASAIARRLSAVVQSHQRGRCDAVFLSQQAKDQVLSADVVVIEALRFLAGELQRLAQVITRFLTAIAAVRHGDRVRIQETRPLSKQKRWRVVEVLERAK